MTEGHKGQSTCTCTHTEPVKVNNVFNADVFKRIIGPKDLNSVDLWKGQRNAIQTALYKIYLFAKETRKLNVSLN